MHWTLDDLRSLDPDEQDVLIEWLRETKQIAVADEDAES
jgi:hypothetical protein